MKRNVFITIAWVFLLAGCAEKVINRRPLDITIDFGKREIQDVNSLQKMKPGNFYRVKIENINLNAWKVKIGNHDSSTATPLTFPNFASVPIDNLQKAVGGLSSLGSAVVALRAAVPLTDSVLDFTNLKMMTFRENFNKTYSGELRELLKDEAPAAPTPNRDDEIRALLTSNEHALKDSLAALVAYKKKIDSVLMLASQTALNAQLEPRQALFGRGIPADKLLENVTSYRNHLDAMSRWVVAASKSFLGAREAYATAIEAKPEFKKLDEQIKKSYAEFEPAVAAVRTPLNVDNIAKVFLQYIAIENTNGDYLSLPIQFTADVARVNIEIIPRNENSGLSPQRIPLMFPTKTFDKFWGLSSGFYVSTPASEAYSTRVNIGTDTTYSLVAENPGKLEIGFNTMLRYGSRIKSPKLDDNLYWHIGIGPGISVSDKVRPRMLLGTGLAFGEDHTWVVDAGAIIGYYDVKSAVFEEEGPYAIAPANITVSRLKTGLYFSIGYLFLK